MMSQTESPSSSENRAISDVEFMITRVFTVPRELVFKAWVEPERLAQWWGPAGFTMKVLQLEAVPGGVFHYALRSPTGFTMWGKFNYQEIIPPERIVSTLSFADEQGHPVRHPMSPTWPLETLNILTLTETDGKTALTLRSSPHEASELESKTFRDGHDGMTAGFNATFAQLAHYLGTS
ncbi:MAG: SRPBCC domain-containing protein [Pseudomonadota bacterium]